LTQCKYYARIGYAYKLNIMKDKKPKVKSVYIDQTAETVVRFERKIY